MTLMAWLDKPTQKHKKWRVNFHDQNGNLRRLMGFPNKRTSEQLGRNIESLVQCVASGSEWPEAISHWIRNQIGKYHQDKLLAFGLIGQRQILAGALLGDHINDWHGYMLAENTTDLHANQQKNRVTSVLIDECGYQVFSDISPERVTTATASLAKRRRWSRNTELHYLRACKAFSSWMQRFDRTARDPLVIIRPQPLKRTEVSHNRYAMTRVEAEKLVQKTTANKKKRGGMTGAERSMVYQLVLFETGFRAATVKALRVRDFDLKGMPATVTGVIKQGRHLELPLSNDMVIRLKPHLGKRDPDEPAFNCPGLDWFADMVALDLKDAGIRRDRHGAVIDFHALRHSFATMASKVMDMRTLQEYMGHTSVNLTARYYTHRLTSDLSDAKQNMPRCGVQCGGHAPTNANKRHQTALG